MDELFEKAKARGISSYSAVGFMPYQEDEHGNIKIDYEMAADSLAMDADLITTPNVGVPTALTTYIDPLVVPIMFGAMNSTKMFKEHKKGSWTDTSFMFDVEEYTGGVTAYSDFANNVTADVNNEWVERGNFLFQSVLRYGELEEATAARAKLTLASTKQRSAAYIMSNAHNKFNLYGVAGRNIYGMLNDPNLAAAETPNTVTIGGNNYTTWANKLQYDAGNIANHVFNDISKLFGKLSANNGGHIDQNTPMKLGISNSINNYLAIPNTYGLTAQAMLKTNFPNLEIVLMPELTAGGTNTLYLEVPELMGIPTAEFSYSEKLSFGRIVPQLSSYEQKIKAGTSGFVLKRPSLIARMTGV